MGILDSATLRYPYTPQANSVIRNGIDQMVRNVSFIPLCQKAGRAKEGVFVKLRKEKQ